MSQSLFPREGETFSTGYLDDSRVTTTLYLYIYFFQSFLRPTPSSTGSASVRGWDSSPFLHSQPTCGILPRSDERSSQGTCFSDVPTTDHRPGFSPTHQTGFGWWVQVFGTCPFQLGCLLGYTRGPLDTYSGTVFLSLFRYRDPVSLSRCHCCCLPWCRTVGSFLRNRTQKKEE